MLDPFSVSLCALSTTLYNLFRIIIIQYKTATQRHMYITFLQEKKITSKEKVSI